MTNKDFLKKNWKVFWYGFLAVFCFVSAFLANVPDGLHEIPLEVKAEKIVIVEDAKLPNAYERPLPFFYEEQYELVLINKKGRSIQYFGEKMDGRWVQSEWISLDAPFGASIKELEVRDQKLIVHFGRILAFIITYLLIGIFFLFLALGLLTMHTSIKVKFEKNKRE